jgi:hypothetical protein
MTDLSTYVDQYRAAFDSNDVATMTELLEGGVPENLLVSFHRAVQQFDPVTPPKIDAVVASDHFVKSGRADQATADFLGAVAGGDLPSFVAFVMPEGAETATSERILDALAISADRAEAVSELSTYLGELAGRGSVSILADSPEADQQLTQRKRTWRMADRALAALGDVLGMPQQVMQRMRDATERPPAFAGGLARGDGALVELVSALMIPRSEISELFDTPQEPS